MFTKSPHIRTIKKRWHYVHVCSFYTAQFGQMDVHKMHLYSHNVGWEGTKSKPCNRNNIDSYSKNLHNAACGTYDIDIAQYTFTP